MRIPDRTWTEKGDTIPARANPSDAVGWTRRTAEPTDLEAGGHGASVQIGGNNEAMQNYFNNLRMG